MRRAPVGAKVPSKGRSFDGGVQNFQTFRDNNDDLGFTILLRSVVRMRVDHSKMLFGFVHFEFKARRHSAFKSWMDLILGQADMGKFSEGIDVLRPLQYALLMDVDRSPVELHFLISRWSSHSHTFVAAWGEFCPSFEDVFMLSGLFMFRDYHAVDALDNEGKRLLKSLHDTMMRAKYISNKETFLSWLKYFTEDAGQNPEVQLAAFFAY